MISYFIEHKNFKLRDRRILKTWITTVIKQHSCRVGDINIIYCDDEYILKVNIDYLNHNYYTDVITFDTSEYGDGGVDKISGDVFISVDTVSANAKEYGVDFEEEFLRVTIHGVLHLLGFNDSSEKEKEEMRFKENESIEFYRTLC